MCVDDRDVHGQARTGGRAHHPKTLAIRRLGTQRHSGTVAQASIGSPQPPCMAGSGCGEALVEVRRLRLVTLVVLGVLLADIVGFIVGFSTCGDDGQSCGSAHAGFNGATAYLGIALGCVAAILALMVFAEALVHRRS